MNALSKKSMARPFWITPLVQSYTVEYPQARPRKKSGLKKVLVGLVKIAAYLVFVGTAVYYTPKVLSKTLNTPYPLATITSGSMWPQLKVNDLILMKGASGSQVEAGQIIIFKNAKGFTIHRLMRKEADGKLITRGDANNVDDAPIKEADVIGRAVYVGRKPFRIPKFGFMARSLGPKLQHFE
jgi:signal peptidase I